MNMDGASSGDWRTQLPPGARTRIVNKIMDTLERHFRIHAPENLGDLRKLAMRFEDKVFTAAISQTDYLRRISLKMLTMESKTENTSSANQMPSNSPNQNASEGSFILSQICQQTLAQGIQNNLSTMTPAVDDLPQTMSNISQTSNLQTMPSTSQTSLQQGQTPVMQHESQPNELQQSSSSSLAVLWQQQTQPPSGLSQASSQQPRASPPGHSGVQAPRIPSWARQQPAAHTLPEVEAAGHSSSTGEGSHRLRARFLARRWQPRVPFKPRRLRSHVSSLLWRQQLRTFHLGGGRNRHLRFL